MYSDEVHVKVVNMFETFVTNNISNLEIKKIETEVGEIYIVDNLFVDVEKVFDYARDLTYYNSINILTAAPVFRTLSEPCHFFIGSIVKLVERILDTKNQYRMITSNSRFSFSYQSKKMLEHCRFMLPHIDVDTVRGLNYSSIIYLNDHCGTAFFDYKYKNQYNNVDHNYLPDNLPDPLYAQNFYIEHLMENFKEVYHVEGKANRFVIYDSMIYHRPDYFRVGEAPFRIVQNLHFEKN